MRAHLAFVACLSFVRCTAVVGPVDGDTTAPVEIGVDAGEHGEAAGGSDGGGSDSGTSTVDSGPGEVDAGEVDAGEVDAGEVDAGEVDAGIMTADAGRTPLAIGVGNWGLRSWSTDDTTWNACGNMATGNDHSPDLLRNIAFGDGVWIAVGGDANSMVMRSLDGAHWQENLHPTTRCPGEPYPSSCTNWMEGLAYGNGVWLAGGGNGALMRSNDRGLTWTGLHPSPSIPAIRSLAFAQGVFVAGTDAAIAVSTDQGSSWTRFPAPFSTTISFGGGRFFALGARWNGSGFDRICLSSADLGVSWQPCAADAANAEQLVWGGTRWIGRVSNGYISSADGITWAPRVAVNDFPYNLRFDGTRWLALGGRRYSTSTDLLTWTVLATNLPDFRNWAVGFIDGANLPVQGGPVCQDNR